MTDDYGERAKQYLLEGDETFARIPTDAVHRMAAVLVAAYRDDRQVILMGNGGSAALASHAAVDLSKGTSAPGRRRFRVISIVDNTPVMTAYANDLAYSEVFAEQIRTLARSGDVVWAISGSGNSPNVLNGLRAAREKSATTILLTGFSGGHAVGLADAAVVVPSDDMQHIEDAHLAIVHIFMKILCDAVRNGDRS